MKLILLPLMFSVACIAYQNRDKIADQYNAAYPTNPTKEAAIQHCLATNPNFNRMDGDDRKQCYRENLGSTPVAITVAAPTPSPYYAFNPSHLAANDIRRQQANDAYLQASMIQAAAARPVVVVATSYHPAAQAHGTVQAYRTTTVVAHTTLAASSR